MNGLLRSTSNSSQDGSSWRRFVGLVRRNQTRVHDDAGSSAERPDSDQRSTSHQHAKHHHRSVLLWRRCDMGRVLPVPWTTCALGVQFGSVLQPSSIRRLATPSTYFLHLSLSSVILIDSSKESPVHVLMLSIQAVCGLPRLRAPDIDIPCIISLSRQLPCFFMV